MSGEIIKEMKNNSSERRYLLNPTHCFRGWKLLPYGLSVTGGTVTEFFDKRNYALLLDCDGETLIDYENLSDEERWWYDFWEKGNIIHRCEREESLLPIQKYRYYECRYKESVQWSITGKCNYKCRHCFMSAPHPLCEDPSYEELLSMLDAFERCGIRGISLTGGEPLIRKDFWQLVDEILKRGLFVTTIYSNGLLLSDDFFKELDKRKIRPTIQLSFDGVGHHDWMRGVKGAEQTAIDALKRCREHGIQTTCSMAMCKESASSIRKTVNLLAELGCAGLKINNAAPQGEWLNEPQHFLSQAEANQIYLDYIPYFYEDGKPLSLTLEGLFDYHKDTGREQGLYEKHISEKYFSSAPMCSVIRRNLYVSPQGNVLPCMSLVGMEIESEFPSMLKMPLEHILDDPSHYMGVISFRISDYMDHNRDCRECEFREACCGGCRAAALRYDPKDYLSKDLSACEYFKGGWKQKKEALIRRLEASLDAQ